MLPHQDKISILITFAMGFVLGGYVYLTGFVTTFALPTTAPADTYSGLVIEGESYGGCSTDNTCLSFQLLSDSTYRLLFYSVSESKSAAKEGSITSSLRKELDSALLADSLVKQSQLKTTQDCKYGATGTNYRFKISLDNKNYRLDTCTTEIDYNKPIWLSLAKLWNYFAVLTN